MPIAPTTLAYDTRAGLLTALRSLARRPALALTVLLLLGLGVGTSAAMFSVVRGVLAHAVPYPREDELVEVTSALPAKGVTHVLVSYPRFEAYAAQARTFAGLGAFWRQNFALTGGPSPVSVSGARVSPDFFRTLGVAPLRGRDFTALEQVHGGPSVAIIGEGLWRSQFGAAPDIVGRAISIDGQPTTIVGIVPARFAPPLEEAQLWLPRVFEPDVLPQQQVEGGAGFLSVVGRLKPGVSTVSAQRDLQQASADYRKNFGGSRDVAFEAAVEPLTDYLVGKVRASLLFLWLAGTMVFLIACANAGNVLLARYLERRAEFSIRSATGATRRQLLLHLLGECAILAVGGSVVGLLVARGSLRALAPLAAEVLATKSVFAFDIPVFLFAAGLAAAAVVAAGLVPALDATSELRGAVGVPSRHATAGRSAARWRRGLVIAQVAVSYVLLAGAVQQMVSLVRAQRVDRGFAPDGLLAFQVAPSQAKYPTADSRLALYQRLEELLAQSPGITAVGASQAFPVGDDQAIPFTPEAERLPKPGEWPLVQFRIVSPGYFGALGVSLHRGRIFTAADTRESPSVTVINETMARKYFGGADPVGRRVFLGGNPVPREILGVVSDVSQRWLVPEPLPEAYVPETQMPARLPPMYFLVRSHQSSVISHQSSVISRQLAAALAIVRTQLAQIDPAQPVTKVTTMAEASAEGLAVPHLRALLAVVFALMGTLLAAIGMWSVMSQLVSERTRELGVRIALGAPPRAVLRLVLATALSATAVGLAAGVLLSLSIGGVARHLLVGIESPGAIVLAGAGVLLLGTALVAALVPAVRASRIDVQRSLAAMSIVLLALVASPARVRAQQPPTDSASAAARWMLKTRDGSVMVGRLSSESADSIRFETSGGLLVLPRTSVAELRRVDARNIHDGQYWVPDPNATRLFFAPTARTLEQGEMYFSDTYLFFLNLVGGVTDRLTLGGGFSVFPSSDFSNNVFYLTPKVGLWRGDDFNLAAGALVGFAGKASGSGGVLYGVATKGGPDASATVGAGWLYGGNKVASKPVIVLGGNVRVSRRVSLLSENYIITGGTPVGLWSYGARFFGEKLSVDLAFFNAWGAHNSMIFPGIPYLSFSIKF